MAQYIQTHQTALCGHSMDIQARCCGSTRVMVHLLNGRHLSLMRWCIVSPTVFTRSPPRRQLSRHCKDHKAQKDWVTVIQVSWAIAVCVWGILSTPIRATSPIRSLTFLFRDMEKHCSSHTHITLRLPRLKARSGMD